MLSTAGRLRNFGVHERRSQRVLHARPLYIRVRPVNLCARMQLAVVAVCTILAEVERLAEIPNDIVHRGHAEVRDGEARGVPII